MALLLQLPGRKQVARNDDFIRTWDNIDKIISLDEAESLVHDTVVKIKDKIHGKNVGYAWSGGKDSIALQIVCEFAGISKGVIGLSHQIEYPHYLNWIRQNKPEGILTWDANIGYDWLIKNPFMVFPTNSFHLSRWYALIQHSAQNQFFKDAKLDILCLGRRHQDGNYTGDKGQNIYTDKKGVTRFSPIAQWRHEHVLAVCHYFANRNLPPIYNDPEGWVNGTGVWPIQTSNLGREHSWEILYQISPETIHTAANYFKEARLILESHGKAS